MKRPWKIEFWRNAADGGEPRYLNYGVARYATWGAAVQAAARDIRLQRWAKDGTKVRVVAPGVEPCEVFP